MLTVAMTSQLLRTASRIVEVQFVVYLRQILSAWHCRTDSGITSIQEWGSDTAYIIPFFRP